MYIDYQCPHCGRRGQALKQLAGSVVTCPDCKQGVQLPGGEEKEEYQAPPQPSVRAEVHPARNAYDEAVIRLADELQRGFIDEMQRQGKQLDRIASRAGCILAIMVFWLVVSGLLFVIRLILS